MKLVGKGIYNITSKPTFDFSINNIRKAHVEMPTDYYYDILKEEKLLIVDDNNQILFVGVIDEFDFNTSSGIMVLYMTEYIGIIIYNSDMLGAPTYDVVYTSQTAETIATEILNGTGFTVGFIPPQTIDSLEAKKYNRLEWLELLNSNIECGLDSDGNYTTISGNIISGNRSTDIICDYKDLTVSFGVRGCYRQNNTSNIWIQKTLNLDDYIIEIDQYKDKVFRYNRVVVLGDDVNGSAYVNTSTDIPVKVITDDSCKTVASCNLKAETELNLNQKLNSITLQLNSSLFYDNNIEEGMLVSISKPINIAGEYILNSINISGDDLKVTLGSPKQTMLSSLYDLEKRLKNVERWK